MLKIEVAGTLKCQGVGGHHKSSILYCNSDSINELKAHLFSIIKEGSKFHRLKQCVLLLKHFRT